MNEENKGFRVIAVTYTNTDLKTIKSALEEKMETIEKEVVSKNRSNSISELTEVVSRLGEVKEALSKTNKEIKMREGN